MDIEKYKQLLDSNSNDALGYVDESKSRFQSFLHCLQFLKTRTNPSILELGTTRSFVGGAFEGCNLSDVKYWNPNDYTKWDFGAGAFTLLFGQLGYDLSTVDLMRDHIIRCKIMTDSLNIACNHYIENSITFLQKTQQKYDLIYLDTGDMHPIEPSENLQLEEAKLIVSRGLLKDGGIILIDDVLNHTPRTLGNTENRYGKSTKSLPYLQNNGFDLIFTGLQYILQERK
jgi:hypothetical protein